MHHDFRPALALARARGLGEGGVEVAARRRGDQPEGMCIVGRVDALPVVGQGRHAGMIASHACPVGAEAEAPAEIPRIYLQGDICRENLLTEIDGIVGCT